MSTTRNTKDSLAALAHDLERFDFLGHISLGGGQYWAWRDARVRLGQRADALGDDGVLLWQACIDAANETLPGKAW